MIVLHISAHLGWKLVSLAKFDIKIRPNELINEGIDV